MDEVRNEWRRRGLPPRRACSTSSTASTRTRRESWSMPVPAAPSGGFRRSSEPVRSRACICASRTGESRVGPSRAAWCEIAVTASEARPPGSGRMESSRSPTFALSSSSGARLSAKRGSRRAARTRFGSTSPKAGIHWWVSGSTCAISRGEGGRLIPSPRLMLHAATLAFDHPARRAAHLDRVGADARNFVALADVIGSDRSFDGGVK